MIDRVLDGIARALLVVAAIVGFLLAFIVCIDVIGRVALNRPLKGTPELVSSAIVVICWLQASYAIRSGGMINVDAFTSPLPHRVQSALGVFGSLLGVALFAIIGWASIEQSIYAWVSGEYDGEGALRVPTWPARFIMTIGAFLAAVSYVVLAIKQFRAFRTGEPPVVASSSHAT